MLSTPRPRLSARHETWYSAGCVAHPPYPYGKTGLKHSEWRDHDDEQINRETDGFLFSVQYVVYLVIIAIPRSTPVTVKNAAKLFTCPTSLALSTYQPSTEDGRPFGHHLRAVYTAAAAVAAAGVMGQATSCCTACCPCPSWRRKGGKASRYATGDGDISKLLSTASLKSFDELESSRGSRSSSKLRRPPSHLRECAGGM